MKSHRTRIIIKCGLVELIRPGRILVFCANADIIFLERKKARKISYLMVDKIIINGCLCTNLLEDYDIMPMLSQVLYKEQGIDTQHMNSMFLILVL
jgi:hypothetical protein